MNKDLFDSHKYLILRHIYIAMKSKFRLTPGSIGLSAMAFLVPASSISQKLPEKPNILIIITDQQSSESMSCTLGNSYINTPNMDYLANHGINFTNAYCANPLSVPSRSSMFTGMYPHQIGIQSNDNNKIDPVIFPNLGTIFEKAGYETGYTGKWHLPYDVKDPSVNGFSYMKNIKNNGIDSMLPEAATKFLKAQHKKPFLLVASFVDPHNICEWARGQKLPDGSVGPPPSPSECPPLRKNSAPSENETDIMKLIRTSYQASKTFPVGKFSDDKWRQYTWAYYRMIEKTDNEIGKILTTLRESGLDKNTIVVFLSDHGDCQGAHHWNQKTVFYEEASKVPFIISNPGLKPGKSDVLVQTGIDLMPTLCDLAGIKPKKALPGISMKPVLISGQLPEERDYVVVSDWLVEGDSVNGDKPEPEGRMLRDKRFKYWILNEGQEKETLYDLQTDPGEMINLSGDPKYRTNLENCRKKLADWAEKNKDPFITHLVR